MQSYSWYYLPCQADPVIARFLSAVGGFRIIFLGRQRDDLMQLLSTVREINFNYKLPNLIIFMTEDKKV